MQHKAKQTLKDACGQASTAKLRRELKHKDSTEASRKAAYAELVQRRSHKKH